MPQNLDRLIEQQEHYVRIFNPENNKTPTKIPIRLGGGVGDVIMNTGLVDSIRKAYGSIEIYTEHPDTYNYFTCTEDALHTREMPHYTWLLDVCGIVAFNIRENFLGLNPNVQGMWKRQQEVFKKHRELKAYAKHHPEWDNSMARWAFLHDLDRRSLPFFSLGLPFVLNKRPLKRIPPEKYITIHDGYEVASAFSVRGRATKQWKWTHWNTLVQRIKKEYPDYEIIQLGTSTARPIDGVDRCMINETHLLEAFDIIAKGSLHIDGDSGLMHAATHLRVPCVVLFGPTPDYFYGYSENINLRTKTCADACFWLKKDWLNSCPIGHSGPQCLDDLEPDVVFEAVQKQMPQETTYSQGIS